MKYFTLCLLILMMLTLSACNTADLAKAISSAADSSTASATTSSTTSSSSSSSSLGCYYKVSITYDLGPGIDVSENFMSYNVDVEQKVVARSAQNCPPQVSIPVLNAWKTGYADEVIRDEGKVTIYPSRHNSTSLIVTNEGFLSSSWSVSLSAKTSQVSNGLETMIYNSGTMTSSDSSSSNAKMILYVTYYYESKQQTTSSSENGWMSE